MLLFSSGNNFFCVIKIQIGQEERSEVGFYVTRSFGVSIEVHSRKRIYSSTGIVKIFLIYNHDRSLLQLNK